MIEAIKAFFTDKPRVPEERTTGYNRWQNCSCGWIASMFTLRGDIEKDICPECGSEELTTIIGQWHYHHDDYVFARDEPIRFEPKVCKFLKDHA